MDFLVILYSYLSRGSFLVAVLETTSISYILAVGGCADARHFGCAPHPCTASTRCSLDYFHPIVILRKGVQWL